LGGWCWGCLRAAAVTKSVREEKRVLDTTKRDSRRTTSRAGAGRRGAVALHAEERQSQTMLGAAEDAQGSARARKKLPMKVPFAEFKSTMHSPPSLWCPMMACCRDATGFCQARIRIETEINITPRRLGAQRITR
jgi:hypothetical protein